MIELPESINISKQLKEVIEGKKVVEVITAKSPHGFAFYTGDPEYYDSMLIGKSVTDVHPNGGQIEMEFGDVHLTFNDGTNIRYYKKDEKEPPKHQLLIRFDDGSYIVVKIQMYGGMMVFYKDDYDNEYYLVAKEKPFALSEDFTEAYFLDMYNNADKKLSAKAFLATEQRIPGLGNGVLQDILFEAGINPQTKLKNLSTDDIKLLYKSTMAVLNDMTAQGGRDTEKNIYGEPGGYKTVLSNKTLDQPCPKCCSAITKKAYLGGSVYFCPVCQPILK